MTSRKKNSTFSKQLPKPVCAAFEGICHKQFNTTMIRTALTRCTPILLLICAPLTGCDTVSEDDPDALFRAEVAGKRWIGETNLATGNGAVYVTAHKGDVNSGNYERIGLTIVGFTGEGEYQLEEASYSEMIGGDAVWYFGSAEAAPENVVTITRYDTSADILEGEFRFEAVASRSFDGVAEGESFEVVGRFEARLPEVTFYAVKR